MNLTSLVSAFGGTVWAALALVVAVSIIVTVHEYGHYIVGRICGIHAEVFSVGFGRTLYARVDRRGTRWQIAMLPIGGFVKFIGDADAASRPDGSAMRGLSDEERRHTMPGAPLWARAATVAAGPIFNFILTFAVFAGLTLWNGIATDVPVVGRMNVTPFVGETLRAGDALVQVNGTPTPDWQSYFALADKIPGLGEVAYVVNRDGTQVAVNGSNPLPALVGAVHPNSAALDAGLQAGDVILRAAGQEIHSFAELPPLVEALAGQAVPLTIWRDGKTFDLTLTPRRTDLPKADGTFETRWLIGLSSDALFTPKTRWAGPWEIVTQATEQSWFLGKITLIGMKSVFTGSISSCSISGPIGMAKVVGAAARSGLEVFIQTIAVLSIGIGLLNLLPIPILDGGHLVFHAYEAIFRRPPNARVLNLLMTIGLGLILGLMVFALSNDLLCP